MSRPAAFFFLHCLCSRLFCVFVFLLLRPAVAGKGKAIKSASFVDLGCPPVAAGNIRARFSKPSRRRGDQKRVIRGPGSPLLLLSSIVQTNILIILLNSSDEGDTKKFIYTQQIIRPSIWTVMTSKWLVSFWKIEIETRFWMPWKLYI